MLDLKYIMIQRWGKAYGGGVISTYVMARRDFEKGEKITPNAIGLFKRFFKRNFPNEKHLVLSPNKKGKPPRPKIKSWVNPNKTFVIKGKFLRGKVLLEENLNTLLKSNKRF